VKLADEAQNPEGVLNILIDQKRRKTPGDPFNRSVDQFVDFMLQNPEAVELAKEADPAVHLRNYLLMVSKQVKSIVAEKLEESDLETPGILDVVVDDDWQIGAFVETEPPYSIYISMNLFLFCMRMSELLTAGFGLNIVGEEPDANEFTAEPAADIATVAGEVRGILDSFITDQSIPSRGILLKASHNMLHQMIFHGLLAQIVCHEFGHVVIGESRRLGRPVPFADLARAHLEGNIENLIGAGGHDPSDIAGLQKLGEADRAAVIANWENEITADLIGVSLASEYLRDRGPWKGKPGILGFAFLSFHLGYLAQYILQVYMSFQRPNFVLVSRTHPPIDFRMHCILDWMYGKQEGGYGNVDAYKAVTEQSQAVLDRILTPGR
jgi:hypothetical protein